MIAGTSLQVQKEYFCNLLYLKRSLPQKRNLLLLTEEVHFYVFLEHVQATALFTVHTTCSKLSFVFLFFVDCSHNKKQTHYHCIQSEGCDKVIKKYLRNNNKKMCLYNYIICYRCTSQHPTYKCTSTITGRKIGNFYIYTYVYKLINLCYTS